VTFAIHVVGRSREAWLQEAESEYRKRLCAWANVELVVHKAETLGPGLPPEAARRAEAARLLEGLDAREELVALDEGGRTYNSPELAAWLEGRLGSGVSRFRFVVGGAEGLDPELRRRAGLVLSLSRLTFTHQMVRLVLLEQLYRALMIREGRPYHRG
jgi:23S rRNA (pseudouridine1915-N3)-methyltransferase